MGILRLIRSWSVCSMSKDPKRVRAGKRAKRKGDKWENDVNQAYRRIYGDVVYRGDQRNRGGAGPGEGADGEGTPFWNEYKHCGSVSVHAAMRQAREKQKEKGDTRPIVIVVKVDRKEPFVAQPIADWFDMLWELELYREACAVGNSVDLAGLDANVDSVHHTLRGPKPDWKGIINRKVKP